MSPRQISSVPSAVSHPRIERRWAWAGGEIIWTTFKSSEFSKFETICADSHQGLFVLGGYACTRCRKIDGKPAPRGPSSPGEVNFYRAGTIVSGETQGELEHLRILINSSYLADSLPNMDAPSPWIVGSVKRSVWPLIYEVCAHIKNNETPEPLLSDGMGSLLAFNLSQLSPGAAETSVGHGLSSQRLRSVVAYIEANLGKQLMLSDLASLARMSTSHFSVAFRKSTGMPPHRFVVLRRVERAKIMLRDKTLSINEVSLLLGFSSPSHFTLAFKSIIGITPMQYRIENF